MNTVNDVNELADVYLRDGFVHVPGVMPPDLLREVRANIERYCKAVVPKLPEEIRAKTVRFEPDGQSIRSCYFMDQIDEYFNALGNRGEFKALVAAVTNWEPELYVVETFNKYAQIGTTAVPHQDVAYFNLEPMDMAHLWIAIDDATAENGALRYWKGSHRDGLIPHVPAIFGYKAVPQEQLDYDSPDFVTAEVIAGDAVIHSGLVVHDSPHNHSNKPRCGLLCGYRGAHTRFLGLGASTTEQTVGVAQA